MNAMLLAGALLGPWIAAPRAAPGSHAGSVAPALPATPVHAAHEGWYEFDDHELRFRSVWQFRPGGKRLPELRFTLPEDVRIDVVEAAGMAGYTVDQEAYELRVWSDEAGHTAPLTIVGHIPFDAGIKLDAVLLPVPEPQNVHREAGRLHLFAPPGINLTVEREIAVGAVPTVAQVEPPSRGMRHVASFAHRRRPVELLVEMTREPLRLSARVATEASVHARHVEVLSRVEFHVESGRTDVFHVAAPARVADRVQIMSAEGGTIAQATRGEETPGGWVPWNLVTREPVSDRFAIALRWELADPAGIPPEQQIVLVSHSDGSPAAGAGRGAARAHRVRIEPALAFDPLAEEGRPAVLRRAAGVLSVRASEGLDVAVAPLTGRIEHVSSTGDVRHSADARLTARPGSPSDASDSVRLLQTDRYHDQPAAWELTWSRAEPSPAPTAVVRRALVEISTEAAGKHTRATYRCDYDVRTGTLEPLLIDLPAGYNDADLTILGASRDGRPVVLQPAPQGDAARRKLFLIQSPRPSSGATDTFSLTFAFQLKLRAAALAGFGGRLELPLPRVGGTDAVVHELQTILSVPRPYAVLGAPAGFERVAAERRPLRDTGLLEGNSGNESPGLAARDQRDVFRRRGADDVVVVTWWNHSLATWVLSVSVLLIALVLRPTSWRNRLTVVVLMGFAAAMAAVAAAEIVRHGLLAARPGLVAGVLLWAFGSLPQRPRRDSSRASA